MTGETGRLDGGDSRFSATLFATILTARATVTALTIAGSDSSGGAGLQADLKAFEALGVHGASVVTLVTAQGTRGVREVAPMPASLVRAQLAAVFDDMTPKAVKTGALGGSDVVRAVADALSARPELPLVIDPVIRPTRGGALLDDDGVSAVIRWLLPRARVVTPNRFEAEALTGVSVTTPDAARRACEALLKLGARAVLLKGGHFDGPRAIDLLCDGGVFSEFSAPRLEVPPMHGLGCALSALVAGLLAKGEALDAAADKAHRVMHRALQAPRAVGEGLAITGALREAVTDVLG